MMQFLFTKTPLAFFVASLWRDEAFSYVMAKQPIFSLLWSTAKDSNPPLYYLLLKIWMGIFGTSEVALRSLSLIFFWGTLYVCFLIMKDVFKLSTKKSVLYLLLFLINPLLHYYAFEVRMYSMMAFLATLLFYALLKKRFVLYACIALIAMFTHYFLFVVIAFQLIFIFLVSPKHEKKEMIVPLAKISMFYIPWVIVLFFARPPVSGSFWVQKPTISDLFTLPAVILTGYERDISLVIPFLLFLSIIILGLILFGFFHQKSHQKKSLFILLLGWSIGIPLCIYFVSFIKPLFVPRYIIFSSVGLSLLMVFCFEGIRNNVVRIGIGVIIAFYLLSYTAIQSMMRTKAPLNKTFSSIRKEIRKNDIVYVTHEFDFHPAQYYLPSDKIYMYKKTYEELPWFVGKVLIPKERFRTSLPQYPVRAFVVNNDGSYSIQSRN